MFGNPSFAQVPFGVSDSDLAFAFTASGTFVLDFDFQLYVATREFVTASDDEPAGKRFFDAFESYQFRRSILGGTFGSFIDGQGELRIRNTDGQFDEIVQKFVPDGRPHIIRIGPLSRPVSEHLVIFNATASALETAEHSLRIILEDNGFKLEEPFQTNVYAGTGGREGDVDLLGKRKPRAFGWAAWNATPPLVVPSLLIYQVHDGPINGIQNVYDRGIELTYQSDHATYEILAASPVAAGFYATCLSEGYFRLGAFPDGTVTATFQGDNTGGEFVTSTGDIVKRILETSTSQIDVPADLYLPSFETLNPAPVGIWTDQNDTSSVADILARLLNGIGGFAGDRRDGKFAVGRVEAVEGPPVELFDEINIAAEPRRERVPPPQAPPHRVSVGYQRNYTPQPDLGSEVPVDHRAFAAEQYRYATAMSEAIVSEHPFAADPLPKEAYFAFEADAQEEADRLLALWSRARSLYRVPCFTESLTLNIGDVVTLTYPMGDLFLGRTLMVVELSDRSDQYQNEFVGYG